MLLRSDSPRNKFYDLIQSLCDEHERELRSLHSEIAELRRVDVKSSLGHMAALTTEASSTGNNKPGTENPQPYLSSVISKMSDDVEGLNSEERATVILHCSNACADWQHLFGPTAPSEHMPVDDDSSDERKSLEAQQLSARFSSVVSRSHTLLFLAEGQLTVRPIWMERLGTRKVIRPEKSAISLPRHSSIGSFDMIEFLDMRRFIVSPTSRRRLAWDTLAFCALLYDMIVIPMKTFQLPDLTAFIVIDWVTRMYWTLDMPASLLVGYYNKGELITSPRLIRHRYLTTWFALDVVIVGGDWLLFVVGGDDNSNDNGRGFVRLLRVARIARIIRLMRLLKLRRLVQVVEDLIDTESLAIHLNVVMPIVCLLFANHVLGCGWYGVGTMGDREDQSWLSEPEHNMEGRSLGYEYLTSFQWSMAQCSMGNMNIEPTNLRERLFNIVVMLLGISLFSSLISSWTSAIDQFRHLRSDESRQFWLLRRYLKDHGISKHLTQRIHRYADYVYQNQRRKKRPEDISLLSLLSNQLNDELQCEIHTPHLSAHPLFRKMILMPFKAMDKVCTSALSIVELARTEVVFHPGDPSNEFFICVAGQLDYYAHDHVLGCDVDVLSGDAEHEVCKITKGDWAAEVTLWTPWTHVGELVAGTECQLVSINAIRFGECLQQSDPMSFGLAQKYGLCFVELLNLQEQEIITDIMQTCFTPEEVLNREPECWPVQSPNCGEPISPR